jgi:hypothetical protein
MLVRMMRALGLAKPITHDFLTEWETLVYDGSWTGA